MGDLEELIFRSDKLRAVEESENYKETLGLRIASEIETALANLAICNEEKECFRLVGEWRALNNLLNWSKGVHRSADQARAKLRDKIKEL